MITFSLNSIWQFNEDLNKQKIFAYPCNEYEKLSGQLLLDVAGRLLGTLKRRYLDFLAQFGFDLNRPGFDALQKFVVHELSVMFSEYAQNFFKPDSRIKLSIC